MNPPYLPIILWIIGLPSAGKSSLADGLTYRLKDAKYPTILLDGDDLRIGLCRGLGFGDVDRTENLRRAAEVAAGALGYRNGCRDDHSAPVSTGHGARRNEERTIKYESKNNHFV